MEMNMILGWAVKILFLIFSTIFAIQLILKITGHSPTEMQLLYIALSAILSYILITDHKHGIIIGESKEFMKTAKRTFSRHTVILDKHTATLEKLCAAVDRIEHATNH